MWLAPWLIGAGLVGIVLALIMTIRAYVRLRRGEYYVIRKEALRTALRWSFLVLLFFLLTVGLLFIPRQTRTPQLTSTATPGQTHTSTSTRAVPTPTATTTPTARATATAPFIPTSTPQATMPPAFTSPLPSAIPPPGDARFEFWTLAQGADENSQPVAPSNQFPVGIERIYLFFRYDGLLLNVPWTIAWYRNGELLSGGTRLWESRQPAGNWYQFMEFNEGYPAGKYEVQVWLGEQLRILALFSVGSAEE